MCEAAANGKLDCLMFMHERGCPCQKPAVDSASDQGNLEMLRYLLSLDFPRGNFFVALAAGSNGKDEHGCSTALRCVEYLVGEQGMYMDEDGSVFGRALMNANISVVQYLVDNGCPIRVFPGWF